MPEDIENLLRRLIGGDAAAPAAILDRAATSCSPSLLVAAALVSDESDVLLARAAQHAENTRDRQLAAVAAAYLRRDHELLDALVRDHLADYPDSLLAAWIAATHSRTTNPPISNTRSHHA